MRALGEPPATFGVGRRAVRSSPAFTSRRASHLLVQSARPLPSLSRCALRAHLVAHN
jgi:hypothetical protein